MQHEKFKYKSREEVLNKADELDVHIPMADSTNILKTKLSFGNITVNNRMGIAPMEGADSLADGSPSELTTRRYVREAIGGSAIIWFEAISIVSEGRSGLHQLMLTKDNLEAYKRFTSEIKEAGMRANGYAPYLIMQANHSGRYSNPDNKPAPLIAYRNPICEKLRKADDSCVVTDDYLKALENSFGEAAKLAKEAGFDAIDIKSCHGYLLAELLSAYNRPGEYGGCLENRSRLLRNGIKAAKAYESEDFLVTARIGIYDGMPYPYGFGVSKDTGIMPCLDEPLRLVKAIYEDCGLSMVNLTMGNPYVTAHVTRPFDIGKYIPDEHPFEGMARMINGIGSIKKNISGLVVLASAPSYLREYSDLFAAGAIEEGLCDGMLFGRMSFANPEFANQIIKNGRLDQKKVCITCGKCGDLIRASKPTGCVIRDTDIYMPYYREYQEVKGESNLSGLIE